MDIVIFALIKALDLYSYVILGAVIVSWLINFGVINTYHPLARSIVGFLEALTEPVFRMVRHVIPAVGGLDLSPLVVWAVIQWLLIPLLMRAALYAQ